MPNDVGQRQKLEWKGVTELFDPNKNGLYRANATALAVALYGIVSSGLIVTIDPSITTSINLYFAIAFFLMLTTTAWISGYFLGRNGLVFSYHGYIIGATKNTDLSPRANDSLVVPPGWLRGGWRQTRLANNV